MLTQRTMRVVLREVWRGVGIGGLLFVLWGCGGDATGPSAPTPAQQYWSLTLNHHAITLATIAPYNTIQLVATPRTVLGDPIATAAQPTFTTSDTSITIDSTGLVTVHGTKTKPNITVIATLTVGGLHGLTLADTAIVDVVQQTSVTTIPVFTRFVFQPAAGDSARRSVLSLAGATVTQALKDSVLDVDGKTIPSAVVRYTSIDPFVAKFATATTGTVTPVSPGTVLLTAEATVYGVRQVDTLMYVVGYSLFSSVQCGTGLSSIFDDPATAPANNSLSNTSVTIGTGGVVAFINFLRQLPDDSLDIVFDDASQVKGLADTATLNGVKYEGSTGDNIPAFGTVHYQAFSTIYVSSPDSTSNKARVFPVAGDYAWHSLRQPYAGVIHVVSNDVIH